MKSRFAGSYAGFEMGAPQISSPPVEKKVDWKLTGVASLIASSGPGNTLLLTTVYGKMSGSSMLISDTAPLVPPHCCMIRRWNICTGQPRNPNWRDTGKPKVSTPPRELKKFQNESLPMRKFVSLK